MEKKVVKVKKNMKDEEGGKSENDEKRLCTNGVSGEEGVGRGIVGIIYRNEKEKKKLTFFSPKAYLEFLATMLP